jgi:hypothetical protein
MWFQRDDTVYREREELRARNAELHAANGQLRETIEGLRQQVAELQGRIIEDNHRIIDHFAMRATNSPVFANPPEQPAPVMQADPRPRLEDIAERETRKFYQNHRIAGLGLPLTPQVAPADMNARMADPIAQEQ